MPFVKINYDNTYLYKIISKDLSVTDIYVGHTNFTKRKCHHKTSCNNPNNKDHNMNVYKFIRENNGWDNFSMLLIDTLSCKDKRNAEKKRT